MSRPEIDVDGIEAAKAPAGPRPRVHVPERAPSLVELEALAIAARVQSVERRAQAARRHRRRMLVERLAVLALLIVAILTLAL